MASSDSGIEDDLGTEYADRSPRRSYLMSVRTSPSEREYDSDDSVSRKSPRLFNTGKCYRKSTLHDSSVKRPLSPQDSSPRMSPTLLSPSRRFSPGEDHQGYPHYTGTHEEQQEQQGSSESMESDACSKFKVEAGHRVSPKRLIHDERQRLKKIKIEDHDDYEDGLPVLNHCSEGKRISKHGSEPRFLAKQSSQGDRSPTHHYGPRYTHTYPPYPPLFILTDKPNNYSKLMDTYDSIFAPKPPVHPPLLPAYTKCNCGDKNCLIITPPICSPPPPYREKKDSPYRESTVSPYGKEHSENSYREKRTTAEYGLPNVDEHFRKSLGDKYDLIKCQQANEPPSSVDDHFAKALGHKWFKMEYGSKKCSSTRT